MKAIISLLFAVAIAEYNFESCEFPKTTAERIQWLGETLIKTQDILFQNNMSNWIVQGTLLGAVRNKTILRWTTDADIQTYSEYIPTICNKSNIREEFEQNGYRIFDCLPNFFRVCKANFTLQSPKYIDDGNPVEARIDVYGATLLSSGLYDIIFSPCKWNFTGLYPLTEYKMDNITAKGPHDYNKWLTFAYGNDWHIPKRYSEAKDDLCVQI